jgi:hypothetical protein
MMKAKAAEMEIDLQERYDYGELRELGMRN